jgi:hypothetical protein
MSKKMKAFIVALVLAALALMILNYVVGFKIGFTNAKRTYEKKITKTEAKVAEKMKEIVALNTTIDEERKGFIETSDKINAQHRLDMEIFQTTSAKQLKKEKASTEKVLEQLEAKEQALELSEKTIEELNNLNAEIIEASNKAQIALNAEWQEAMKEQQKKFDKCQDWSEALERELYKKTGFWSTAKKVGGGILLGYLTAKASRIIK